MFFWFVCTLFDGPFRVAVEGESIAYALFFPFLGSGRRWNDGCSACECAYCGKFVFERSVRFEVDVLVGVSGFAIDISGEGAVGIALNVDVQHVDVAINLLLFCPFYVRVKGVNVGEELIGMVLMNGDKRIIGFAPPKEDGIAMSKGGKCSLFEIFHEYIREGAGGGFSHAKASRLGVELSPILEVSQLDVEFE